jgi:hypothetical protein
VHWPGFLTQGRAGQFVRAHLGKQRLCPSRDWYLEIVPRTNYSCRSQHWPVIDPVVIQHPPPQNCYCGSSTFSWPIPVRGVHHGRGVRYYALYNVHMGVPVSQKDVSRRTVYHAWLHYWKGCRTKSHVICWSNTGSN